MCSQFCDKHDQESSRCFIKTSRTYQYAIKPFRSPNNISKTPDSKHIKSAKNSDSKKFVFPSIDQCRQQSNTLQRLHALQAQKTQLIKELKYEKENALNTILQRQQVIDQLTWRIEQIELSHSQKSEDRAREEYYIGIQLSQTKSQIEKLMDDKSQINGQHIITIINKDKIIVELGEELQQTKIDIVSQQIRDRALTEKLYRVEEQNDQLYDQLIRSKSDLSKIKDSLKGSAALSCSLNKSLKEFSPRNRFSSQQLLQIQESKDSQQPYVDPTLQCLTVSRLQQINEEQKQRHRQQIDRLKSYYEDMLTATSSQFYHGLAVTTKQNNGNYGQEDQSVRSLRQSQNKQEFAQRKSILKNEIMMLGGEGSVINENYFIVECENPQKYISTCGSIDQNQSLFRYKNFQHDFCSLKTSDNTSIFSKLKGDTTKLTANETIKLANKSTHSIRSSISDISHTQTNEPMKTNTLKSGIEELANNIASKYAIFTGGMLASLGIFYTFYKHTI